MKSLITGNSVVIAFLLAFSCIAGHAQTQVDIRSFGARCDGATNDAGAIQAAIDSIPSSGGTVVVSCQALIGSAGLLLQNKSNVTITGNGGNSGFKAIAVTRLGAQGFGPLLMAVRYCNGCVIKDLVFEINNIAEGGLGFDRCSDATAQNLTINNVAYPANAALAGAGNTRNKYIGNRISNTSSTSTDGTRGMWIGNSGDTQTEWNPTVANNTLTNIAATGIAAHVVGATIQGNLVDGSGGSAIKVVPPGGAGQLTTISGNTLRNITSHAIQIDNSEPSTSFNIQNNNIGSVGVSGVYVEGRNFSNSTISGNTINSKAEAGVYLYNANTVTLDNNTITGGQNHGIAFEILNGAAIRNVQITRNTLDGLAANGISVWDRGGSADGISISSNSIFSDGMYGVYIEQNSNTLSNISLSGNCFANLGWGTVSDNRSGGLQPAPSSSSCSSVSSSGTTGSSGNDTTAPSASIVSPSNGATVSATLSITVNATDNVGVAGVQLQIDGASLGAELTKSPYTLLWDPRTVSNGSHSLTATVRDAAGNRATSGVIGIVVSNSDVTAPQITITSPGNGASVSGSVQVTATASDNVGIAGVQFKVDGAALNAELRAGPYSTTLNTGTITNGSHQVSAVARDAAGNQSTSTISINVANSGTVTPPAAPSGGGAYRKKITIQAAQVSGDQVSFPVLVNLASDPDLAGLAQTNGADIYFTSASGAKLAHEIEAFQKSNGSLAAWVNVPALSSTANTVIYMNYGNGSTADQQNAAGVWGGGYSAVWHMREGAATHVDSTGNGNNSKAVAVAASGGVAGKIGAADQFSRAQLSHVTIPASASLRRPTLTVEAWIKANGVGSAAQDVISFGDDVSLRIEWNGAASFYVNDGAFRWMTGRADLRGGFHHIAGVIDGGSKTLTIYVDGVAQGSVPSNSPAYVHGPNVEIGMNAYPSNAYNFDGIIDEARVSQTARSAGWIKTTFANQSSSSFFTLGSPEKQ